MKKIEIGIRKKSFLVRIPFIGIALFVFLYVVAAQLYPGGSSVDPISRGYSWLHNYWCDLLDVYAINGVRNPSRQVAIGAMMVMCFCQIFFWHDVPKLLDVSTGMKKIIEYCGTSSMVIGMFLFTEYHDLVVNLGGFLWGIALALTMVGLYRTGMFEALWIGEACLGLGAINYFIFDTGICLPALAMTQKIALAAYLYWTGFMNQAAYRTVKAKKNNQYLPSVVTNKSTKFHKNG